MHEYLKKLTKLGRPNITDRQKIVQEGQCDFTCLRKACDQSTALLLIRFKVNSFSKILTTILYDSMFRVSTYLYQNAHARTIQFSLSCTQVNTQNISK